MRKILLLFTLFWCEGFVNAQFTAHYELNVGVLTQKVQKLYFENGIGGDFTSDFLFNKKIHLKAAYVTSRLGSALGTNAIKQDNFTVGADWHFFPTRRYQIFTGLNTGYFYADYEEEMFKVLPHTSMLFQFESGLMYKFNAPFTASLSFGYNFINGDGVSKPGTLFPVFYQLKVYYRFK
ncbi:conserved exported hypothetical protein [uncultured Paludibacter sp.]|uniref:Outer membrane protein beta-barrel domain-containing protein n=1 Tax=uncultured Paludibacter sp. TaxID=497635 RepID=A0A653AC69_9BACT|nr:conserved exported hypothetical protein [uncultured Paludibacter sp.]